MNTRVPHPVLAAALQTPEEGVSKPSRAQPTSAITQIAALRPGEHWSRVERPKSNTMLKDFAAESPAMRDALRNSVQASVRHAQKKTGGSYSIETGDFIASNRNIYIVCVVTRVE